MVLGWYPDGERRADGRGRQERKITTPQLRDLGVLPDAGQMVELRVRGVATVANDVTPALALATIA
jgi:hypothetical protein